jgi:arsenate reductase (thioredoxin)
LSSRKLRLLFVCVGNACRSQMAEGFARHFGADIAEVESAGMMPLDSVPSQTRKVMLEREAPIDSQFPKGVEVFRNTEFDLVINMSGIELPRGLKEKERRWTVADPYGRSDGAYRQVRDDLETRVRELLQQIRDANGEIPPAPAPRRGFFGFGRRDS